MLFFRAVLRGVLDWRKWLLLASALILLVTSSVSAWMNVNPDPKIVVGKVPLDREIALVLDDVPPHRDPPPPPPRGGRRAGGEPRFSRPTARGLIDPDGRPPGPAKPYVGTVDDSGGLQFVLILGSDARSGNPERGRTDSIHVLALDPAARRGTIVGIPRDSWVNIPGHGNRKINEAMNLGGPRLAVRTVRDLTGMPIQYYMVTAFEGFRAIVNELGGVHAHIPYDMNDPPSGAFFKQGWHHLVGEEALAYSRNRHVPAGDFARQWNQGLLMIDTLKNLREQTSTREEVERWLRILVKYARVDMSFSELSRLGVLARVTASSSVRNTVAPGRTGMAGRASVVFLNEKANELFRDVREDAIAQGDYPSYGPPPQPDPGESPGESPPPDPPLPLP
ncbi:MAG: LCP family protein [Actinobacteria bacterium]|nr:LCP family protein [Actinomycetota bacterium]